MGIFGGGHTTIESNKISNFTVNTAEYGASVMEVLGTTRINGNVIYYDDFTAHRHESTQRSGKGGGHKTTVVTYTYTVAVIIGLCEGEVQSIGKVWKNKELHQYPSDALQLTLFKGTQEQSPWAYVQGKHPDKALPYKGLAYMAGVIDLGESGSMPNYNFEVKGKLLDTGDGIDVNPADYIIYILQKIGLKDIEIAGIENYRNYCKNADLLISTPANATSAKPARDIINEIAQLTNSYMFWSNDRFKIVPRADRIINNWVPDTKITYDLTANDFIPQSGGACVTFSRKDSSELYNRFTVEFCNRANSYEKECVTYEDKEDIKVHGVRQASTFKAPYIYTKERAVKIAEELARKNKYERNKYTFKLDWAFCCLEVGDLVTLTDAEIGLNKQVAMIDSVTESADGLLTFTAISRAGGDYGAAEYDVHEVDRPFVDFNAPASDTDTPVIFQPPSELTRSGNEIWLAVKGKGENWGGAQVWASDNDNYYRTVGTVVNEARIGSLVASIRAEDTTIEVKVNGTFLSGNKQDAERGNTLCWVEGECLSYTTATLLPNGNYRLEGIIRGQYNTFASSHATGSRLVRCDEALLKVPVRKEDVGKEIWLKFTSLNIFGAGEQSLADVAAYKYTIQPYYIPPVKKLTAYNRYRQLPDGVSRYDIVVKWEPPELSTYLEGQVWYKTDHGEVDGMKLVEGVKADEMAYQGDWLFGGSGKNQVVIPQALVGDTYKIAVATKDEWGVATSPDFAPQTELLVALKTTTPNTPDGFSIAFGTSAIASWQEVTNADIVFYEVRDDQIPGAETVGMLARTTSTNISLPLSKRAGTLYLYAKSAIGKYSAPAVLEYNKPVPVQPNPPRVTAKLGGISVVASPIPSGCNGMTAYINDTAVHSVNNTLTYTCDAGIYDVTVAYTDIFGEGPQSAASRCTVKVTVDKDLISDEAISLDKVDQNIKDAIDQAWQAGQDLGALNGKLDDLEHKVTVDISGAVADLQQQVSVDISAAVDSMKGQIQTVVDELNKAPENNGYKSISDLKVTADGISATVANNKQTQDGVNKTMLSKIDQTAGSIETVVGNLNKAPDQTGYGAISSLKQTADGISATVVANKKEQDNSISQINQKADRISTVVEQNKQTQDGVNKTMLSKIDQTAGSIETVVGNLNKAPDQTGYGAISSLKQTADGISATVVANKKEQDGINADYLSQINQTADRITSVVTKLNGTPQESGFSAITQMVDDINLKVSNGEIVSQINLNDQGAVTIDGKYIHITGDTVFDKNVIIKEMLQAGAVTADKMDVKSLSSITATIGTLRTATSGARMELKDNLIQIYDASNRLRVRMGVW